MPHMIFVNLPVADLAKSKAFYEAIGAVNQPKFTDESAACMVFSETTFIMLLTHDKFSQFTFKRIADAHMTSEMLLVISQESREAVDAITDEAVAAGGREARDKSQDTAYMYSRCFEDLDGHIWEPLWMHPEAAVQVPGAFANAATDRTRRRRRPR
ncbi:VOC family protein [Ensifer aridi]|uniref:VOC family protein n=1 Tax=Ensifer aridi TaxID=1708715 RepID=UPI000686DB5E|nr:lactoylglutathione lyase [Ensifer aridi]